MLITNSHNRAHHNVIIVWPDSVKVQSNQFSFKNWSPLWRTSLSCTVTRRGKQANITPSWWWTRRGFLPFCWVKKVRLRNFSDLSDFNCHFVSSFNAMRQKLQTQTVFLFMLLLFRHCVLGNELACRIAHRFPPQKRFSSEKNNYINSWLL